MSLSVRSKKKAEILDVTLDVEFVLQSIKKSKVFPIKIVLGDHEIVGDFIILKKVSHLNNKIPMYSPKRTLLTVFFHV